MKALPVTLRVKVGYGIFMTKVHQNQQYFACRTIAKYMNVDHLHGI